VLGYGQDGRNEQQQITLRAAFCQTSSRGKQAVAEQRQPVYGDVILL